MAEPVALGIKSPTPMSLGDMLSIARNAQAYQQAEQVNPLLLQRAGQEARTGQINLGVAEQTDLERKNIQTFMSDPKNWQNETGDVDVNKINAQVTKIAPLTGRDQIEKLTTLAKSQTENTKAAQDLTQSERAIIAGPIAILARNKVQDKNAYIQELDNVKKYHPDNKRIHRLVETQKTIINQLPKGTDLATAGIRVSEGLLSPLEATTAFAPKTGTLDTGPEIISTVTTPSIGGKAPTIQKAGVLATKELAPSEGGAGIEAGAVKTDYDKTVKDASTAQMEIDSLQKIKGLAKTAIVGTEQSRRQYLEGLNTLLGRSESEIRKTATDELEKNAAILATAGHTDAERALYSAANPSSKMTQKAIENAADQVMAQKKLNILKNTHMGNYVRDPKKYSEELRKWSAIATPQALNYPNMNVEDKKAMINSMTPTERTKFKQQLEALELLDQRYNTGLFPK
jgi:hypothetical protein